MKAMNSRKEKLPLEELLGKLKTEDTKYSNLSKRLQYLYVSFIVLYAIATLFIFIFERESNQFYGAICYLVSFIIFAIMFRKYYKEYKSVDYSLPTIQMLKQAAHRYKPFQWRILWLFFALLLMDAGLTLTLSDHVSVWSAQIFFLGTMVVASIIGLIYWRLKYKAIYDNVLHLISEIEEA